jgi:hypothetical protein
MLVYPSELYVGLGNVGDYEHVDDLGADDFGEGVSEDVLDLDCGGAVGGQRVVGPCTGDVDERCQVDV